MSCHPAQQHGCAVDVEPLFAGPCRMGSGPCSCSWRRGDGEIAPPLYRCVSLHRALTNSAIGDVLLAAGSIPAALEYLTALQKLRVDNNQLRGKLSDPEIALISTLPLSSLHPARRLPSSCTPSSEKGSCPWHWSSALFLGLYLPRAVPPAHSWLG